MDFLLYGASGYTARLTIELAIKQGLKPVLAGRSEFKLAPLAQKYDLKYLVFSLDNPQEIAEQIHGFKLVLNCAGPFSRTAKPMVEACLLAGVHYLDITGEIEVFERVKSYHQKAVDAGIILMSGVGFDVVPTDCVAAALHNRMPDATHLELAFAGLGGGMSHGTMQTMVESLGGTGAARINGKIVPRPVGEFGKIIDFGSRQLFCMSIPWGDVSTAHHSTGIPNITTFTAVPKSSYRAMKMQAIFNPLLRIKFIKRLISNYVSKNIDGPDREKNEKGKSLIWGKVHNAKGDQLELRLETREGYMLTAIMSLVIAQKVAKAEGISGYQTPAGMFGSDLILEAAGSRFMD